MYMRIFKNNVKKRVQLKVLRVQMFIAFCFKFADLL